MTEAEQAELNKIRTGFNTNDGMCRRHTLEGRYFYLCGLEAAEVAGATQIRLRRSKYLPRPHARFYRLGQKHNAKGKDGS